MHGPSILIRWLREPRVTDKYGNAWQYHSRSDRHSKVACWGIALDLVAHSRLLRHHVEQGKVVLGVNHTMRDFATGRQKVLDLVVARPVGEPRSEQHFALRAERYGIDLGSEARALLGMIARLANEYDTTFAAV